MNVTITRADIDEARAYSPSPGSLNFFRNPIAIAYLREVGSGYCAVTDDKIHFSGDGVSYTQDLLPSAKVAIQEWKTSRAVRVGLLYIF